MESLPSLVGKSTYIKRFSNKPYLIIRQSEGIFREQRVSIELSVKLEYPGIKCIWLGSSEIYGSKVCMFPGVDCRIAIMPEDVVLEYSETVDNSIIMNWISDIIEELDPPRI